MKPTLYLDATIPSFYYDATCIKYLLTWNCKHLANANKFEHIGVLTARRRLVAPSLVTPQQLLEAFP